MNPINELDEAQLKHEMRQLYRDHGYLACFQALREMVTAAEILSAVMLEEYKKETHS